MKDGYLSGSSYYELVSQSYDAQSMIQYSCGLPCECIHAVRATMKCMAYLSHFLASSAAVHHHILLGMRSKSILQHGAYMLINRNHPCQGPHYGFGWNWSKQNPYWTNLTIQLFLLNPLNMNHSAFLSFSIQEC